jgi:hypothetical protein
VIEDERGWFGENCAGTEFGDSEAILGAPDCGLWGCAVSLGDSAGSQITLDMGLTAEPCYLRLWQVGVGPEGEQETFSVWVSADGLDFQCLGTFDQAGGPEVLNISVEVGPIRYVRLRQEDGLSPPPYDCLSFGADFDAVAMALSQEPLGPAFDIKPGSCPNPLNPKSKGVMPAAILGADDLDVTEIDESSLLLLGTVAPIRVSIDDVGAPLEQGEPCECTEDGPDGFADLELKFRTWSVRDALGEFEGGDVFELAITGTLLDGTPFQAVDCIVIVGGDENITELDENPTEISLNSVKPNPFRSETYISFTLPERLQVEVRVFEVAGRYVTTVLDGVVEAGLNSVVWDGRNDEGQTVPPGLYFIRFRAAGKTETRKIAITH